MKTLCHLFHTIKVVLCVRLCVFWLTRRGNLHLEAMMQTTHRKKGLRGEISYEYFQETGLSKLIYLLTGRIFWHCHQILFFLILEFSLLVAALLHSSPLCLNQSSNSHHVCMEWLAICALTLGRCAHTLLPCPECHGNAGLKIELLVKRKAQSLSLLALMGFRTWSSAGFIFSRVEKSKKKMKKTISNSKCHKQLNNCFPRNKDWIINSFMSYCVHARKVEIEEQW